jgi:VCBS repeat-containing protein
MMQTDVLSAHINVSGQLLTARNRLKGLAITGGGSLGYTYLWDATSAPVAATYARSSGGVITVTLNAHGLATGDQVGLVFAAGTGGQGTTGNYTVTRTGANTYTVQDINAGAITAGAAALQGTKWITSIDIGANETVVMPLPGQGILCTNGIYATVTNLTGLTVFYG